MSNLGSLLTSSTFRLDKQREKDFLYTTSRTTAEHFVQVQHSSNGFLLIDLQSCSMLFLSRCLNKKQWIIVNSKTCSRPQATQSREKEETRDTKRLRCDFWKYLGLSWETYGNLLHLLYGFSRSPPSGVMVASPQCPSRWIRVSSMAKAIGLPGLPFRLFQFWMFSLVIFPCLLCFASEKRHGSIVLRFSTSVGASSVEEDRLGSQAWKQKKEARSEM